MKVLQFLAPLAMAAIALLSAPAAHADGNGTTTIEYPIGRWFNNPCCDEVVYVSGTIHLTYRTVTNTDGSRTVTYHANVSNLNGTSASGCEYTLVLNEKGEESVSIYNSDTGCFTYDNSYRLVAKGACHDCTFKLDIHLSYCVDEYGNYTFNGSTATASCANGNDPGVN
jgi:hypothetical protein